MKKLIVGSLVQLQFQDRVVWGIVTVSYYAGVSPAIFDIQTQQIEHLHHWDCKGNCKHKPKIITTIPPNEVVAHLLKLITKEDKI